MNYPFKDKFVSNPEQDAEGFTVLDAKCRGCTPDEMCPRSGHCDRYMSPLRETHGIAAWMIHDIDVAPVPIEVQRIAYAQTQEGRNMANEANPVGWREVDGVVLPPITWGRAS